MMILIFLFLQKKSSPNTCDSLFHPNCIVPTLVMSSAVIGLILTRTTTLFENETQIKLTYLGWNWVHLKLLSVYNDTRQPEAKLSRRPSCRPASLGPSEAGPRLRESGQRDVSSQSWIFNKLRAIN